MPLAPGRRPAAARRVSVLERARSARSSPTSPRSAPGRRSRSRTRQRGSLADGLRALHRALRRLPPGRRRRAATSPARVAPPLADATAVQIAEAVRIGPYLMPRFSQRGDLEPRSSTRSSPTSSTRSTRTTAAAGRIGHLGPVPEGLVTWLARGRRARRGLRRRSGGGAREAALGAGSCSRVVLLVARRPRRGRRGRERDRPRRPAGAAQRAGGARCSSASARPAPSASSSSTRSTGSPHQTQLLGLALGLALASLAAALIVVGKRLVVDRGARGASTRPSEHPDEQELVVQIVDESGSRLTRRRLLEARRGRRRRRARRSRCVAPLASLGPVLDTAPLLRDALAARPAPRRRARAARSAPTTSSAKTFYTAFPEGADPEELGVADRRRPPRADAAARCRASRAAGRPTGSSPTRRSAPTRAARSRSTARRCSRRPSRSRRWSARATTRPSTRRPAARCSSAPPAGRCRSCRSRSTARGDLRAAGTLRGPVGAVLVGRAAAEAERVIRAARPLPRRAHRRGAARAQGAALPLPRPLVVPARRDRALLLHRPRRDRHLPDALLRPDARRRRSTTARYAPLRRAQHMSEAYRSVLDISLDGQGRPADPPDPPLGGGRLRRRDRAAPDADRSSPARTASRAS